MLPRFLWALSCLFLATLSAAAPGWRDWDDDDSNDSDYWDDDVIFSGPGTVYSQDDMAGSCGDWNNNDSFVCALSNEWMHGEYKASECGRLIEVTHMGSDYGVGGEGNTIIVKVQDTCEDCDGDHVDLSMGAWDALTDGAPWGQIYTEWRFID